MRKELNSPTYADSQTCNLNLLSSKYCKYVQTVSGLSPHTLRAKSSDIRHFLQHLSKECGIRRVKDLSIAHFRSFVFAQKNAGLKSSTIARRVCSVRAFIAWLASIKAIDTDFSWQITIPKVIKPLPVVLDEKFVISALDAYRGLDEHKAESAPSTPSVTGAADAISTPCTSSATGTADAISTPCAADAISMPCTPSATDAPSPEDCIPKRQLTTQWARNVRNRAILELLYATGMRVGELCLLDVSSLDFSSLTVRILGKGAKERIVPFGSACKNALIAWVHGARSILLAQSATSPRSKLAPLAYSTWDPVTASSAYAETARNSVTSPWERALFLGVRGRRIGHKAVWRLCAASFKQAGYQIGPHKIRHATATHMLNSGADLRSIQELLGHASISSTQIYAHISQSQLVREYTIAHPRA